MKKHVIFYCSVILILFSLQSSASYLVPFRLGILWGMSDENGKMVIPCKYANISYSHPYYFADDTNKKKPYVIYDSTGHMVDTCFYYFQLGGGRCMILSRHRGDTGQKLFRLNDAPRSKYETQKFTGSVAISQLEPPVSAHILMPGGVKKAVPGMVCGYIAGCALAVVAVANKCGIYDLINDSFMLRPKYDSIIYIKPDMFMAFKGGNKELLMDITGKIYSYRPDPNAIFLEKATGNYVMKRELKPDPGNGFRNVGYALMSNDQKELIPAERDWEYGKVSYDPQYIRLRKTKEHLKYGQSVFQMADLNGNIVVPSVQEINNLAEGLLHLVDIGLTGAGDMVFSTVLKKVVLPVDTEKIRLETSNGLPEIRKGGLHCYYNSKGELIASIADSILNYPKGWKLVQKLDISPKDEIMRATGVYRHTYFVFRTDTTKHFTVYDEHFKNINNDYENLVRGGSLKWVSFQRNGKWGLLDWNFKEVVPPVYDKALTTENDFSIGVAGAAKKRIDMETFKVVDVTRFDDFGRSSYKGKFLAVKYETKDRNSYYDQFPKVQTLYVTDSTGMILDSTVKNDQYSFVYAYTGGGKIVKYRAPGEERTVDLFLMDNIKAPEKKCPFLFTRAENCFGKILLVQCVNDKQKLGMISANDFSVVVPFGKYDFMFTYPQSIMPVDNKGNGFDVLEIKGGTDQQHKEASDPFANMHAMMKGKAMPKDRESVGFYSVGGKKFWKN